MPADIVINVAVEGIVDEAVVKKLVQCTGATTGTIYVKNGKPNLLQKIQGYNNAARYSPWVVVVDMDRDADCAPPLRRNWLPDVAQYMCFRIAVREVEAWLMADVPNLAPFLRVGRNAIPANPENLENPKEAMVNLARKSRNHAVHEDMVPRHGSGRPIGSAYSSRLIEFASTTWDPKYAAGSCDSLRRAIECLKRLIQSYQVEHV